MRPLGWNAIPMGAPTTARRQNKPRIFLLLNARSTELFLTGVIFALSPTDLPTDRREKPVTQKEALGDSAEMPVGGRLLRLLFIVFTEVAAFGENSSKFGPRARTLLSAIKPRLDKVRVHSVRKRGFRAVSTLI